MTQQTDSNLKVDLVIIGAGPTGLLLANLLGPSGLQIALIERNPSTVDEPRAVSIDDESMRSLQAAGLSEKVQAIVARGYGSHYIGPSRKKFAIVEPNSVEYGFDKRNGFQQPELEDVMRRALERYDNIIQLFNHDCLKIEDQGHKVIAQLEYQGQSKQVEGPYLAACDGGRSPIRKALGLSLVGSTFAEQWLIVDLKETYNRFRHTEVFCDPARSCITLPGPNNIRRYEFLLHQGEKEEDVVKEDFVRKLLDDFGPDKDAPLHRVRVYTFHARLAEKWSKGRVFLLGDAAHLTPPFAGQGMNSGLRDAHNFAWKIASVLKAELPERILESYEIERRPHAWEMIELALRMGRVMMPSSKIQGFLVRSLFHLLGLYPPAKAYITQMRYKPKPRFAKGLFKPDQHPLKSTMIGRLFPQPIVEDETRKRMRLDDVLPPGPVALLYGETPEASLPDTARAQLEAEQIPIIGLTPHWINPRPNGFPIYRDTSEIEKSFPLLPPYREHGFLLRPDHYVAASAPISQADQLARFWKELMS